MGTARRLARVASAVAPALLAALSPAPARADEDPLRFTLELHGWYTDSRGVPSNDLLFDRSTMGFAVQRYLRPGDPQDGPSALARAGVEGRHGALRFGLLLDTGEVRRRAPQALAPVCLDAVARAPSGLGVPDPAQPASCLALSPVWQVPETALAAPEWQSNGRPLEEEARQTLFFREAWLGATFGKNDFAYARAGRRRFTVGDGFVYDDWGTGLDATFDLGALGPSWEVGAAALYPGRDLPSGEGWSSVLVVAHADFLPSLFEHAGVFGAWYHDRTDSVVELFRGSLAEPYAMRLQGLAPGDAGYAGLQRLVLLSQVRPLGAGADLGWAGTSGSLAWHGVRLGWTGALAFGSIPVPRFAIAAAPPYVRTTYEPMDLFGQLAHVKVRWSLTPEVEVSGFFLYESGDEPPTAKREKAAGGTYGGFLGVSPFVTDTNLFFNGGVSDTFASRQATGPGVNGRGVVAPGLGLSWGPAPSLELDATAAYLVAPVAGPYGGNAYGTELDLEVTWGVAEWLTLLAEGDVLFPGDFFPERTAITKVVVGAQLVAF